MDGQAQETTTDALFARQIAMRLPSAQTRKLLLRLSLAAVALHLVFSISLFASNTRKEPALDRLFNTSSNEPVIRLDFRDIPLSESYNRAYEQLTVSGSSRNTYERLVEEINVGKNETEQCGDWQGRYAASHARQRARFEAGDETVRPVIYACLSERAEFGESGGLADRMKGTTSAFLMALLLDRVCSYLPTLYTADTTSHSPSSSIGVQPIPFSQSTASPRPTSTGFGSGESQISRMAGCDASTRCALTALLLKW